MASPKQIEANHHNACHSTGPKTEAGKHRARGNALRHGLAAETVIAVLEESEDYRAFEAAVTADFDGQTAVERELILRLVSLLWRLRRATAIETGLMQIQAAIEQKATQVQHSQPQPRKQSLNKMMQLNEPTAGLICDGAQSDDEEECRGAITSNEPDVLDGAPRPVNETIAAMARSFLRLADVDTGAFDRLGRYETALWRQVG